jgi:DeoR/GlpR family transcriptional regulator of sugar metabolism
MLTEERRRKITELIEKKGSITVHQLSKKFNVTLMTINRDLRQLQERGEIEAVRGGAIYKNNKVPETILSQRINHNLEAKKIIADKVISFLNPGESIMLDSSTTSIVLASKLRNSDIDHLTIITNSTVVLNELTSQERFNIISSGGVFIKKFHCLAGHLAELLISQLKVDKFLFSVGGISFNGDLTDSDIQEVNLKKKMLESSKKNILMATSSKFNKSALYKITNLDKIDLVVTEKEDDEISDIFDKKLFLPNQRI